MSEIIFLLSIESHNRIQKISYIIKFFTAFYKSANKLNQSIETRLNIFRNTRDGKLMAMYKKLNKTKKKKKENQNIKRNIRYVT